MQRRNFRCSITNLEAENWVNVPTNSIVTINDQAAFVEDIKDQFYTRDPWHRRSAGFVHSKGLAANEKTTTPPALPSPAVIVTDNSKQHTEKRTHLGPSIPVNLIRSVTPQTSRATTPEEPTHAYTPPSRMRATISSGSISQQANTNSSDVRSVTTSSDATRPPPPQGLPSQGNIKKKRRSLSDLPQSHAQLIATTAVAAAPAELDTPTGISPVERSATSYGDPAKIARFFPELTLSP